MVSSSIHLVESSSNFAEPSSYLKESSNHLSESITYLLKSSSHLEESSGIYLETSSHLAESKSYLAESSSLNSVLATIILFVWVTSTSISKQTLRIGGSFLIFLILISFYYSHHASLVSLSIHCDDYVQNYG
jgi:hypothetical protein